MRKLILTLAVLGLVVADSQAFGGRRPVRSLVGRVLHRPAAGGCQSAAVQAAPAGPVRQAVGGGLQHVGGLVVGAGQRVQTVYRPAWDTPACANGRCETIPSPGLPVR